MLDHNVAREALRTRLKTQTGLPAARAWENEDFTPTTGADYVREEYLPGPTRMVGVGTFAELETEPVYVVTFEGAWDKGAATLDAYAKNTLLLFPPATAITLTTGDVLRVKAVPSPWQGQMVIDKERGRASVQVTIPLWARSANTI